MKIGMSTGLTGLLTSIGDREGYGPKHRLKMIRSLRSELPKMVRFLSPLSKKEIPDRLEKTAGEERESEVKAALAELRDSLR